MRGGEGNWSVNAISAGENTTPEGTGKNIVPVNVNQGREEKNLKRNEQGSANGVVRNL